MDVTEWQKRLEQNFKVHGCVGGNLLQIFKQEEACGKFFATTFHGQSVLIDSFQSFFIETLTNARQWIGIHGWSQDCPGYVYIFVNYIAMLRRFRACELLLCAGYPFDGYALLRGLKDQTIILAGIAHDLTTITETWGAKDGEIYTDENAQEITNRRKKEERKIQRLIVGSNSGLPSGIVKELRAWQQMFDYEVHGSRFTISADVMKWFRGGGEPSIGPTPPTVKDPSWSTYMNRAVEVGWLIVRLLPYLQLVENAFGAEWQRKYEVLDDSFRFMEESYRKNFKELAEAFIKFVDAKFSFKKPFYYFEADGSGNQIRG